MQIKRNLIRSIEKRKKEGILISENVPIRLRINYHGNRVDLQTGYRIDIAKWNSDKEKVKNGAFNKRGQSSSDINSGISDLEIVIEDLFKSCEVEERIPTPQEIKTIVKNYKTKGVSGLQEKNEITLFEVFDLFVKINKKLNDWSEATISKLLTVKRHLHTFNPELKFSDMNQEGLADYLIFLRTEKLMRNSTIKKQLGFLKWFLRWSNENNHHQNEDYKIFKPKLKDAPKTIIFLTEEEKKKIIEVYIPESKQYLHRVRDILILLCYTGLRYSDIYNLKRSDIKENHIDTTTIKTCDNLIIEFNKYSKAVIQKYKDIPYENEKALPVISNQKMNDYIKELGELAEINTPTRQTYYVGNKRYNEDKPKYELLGTHVGRRTFICTALSIGIPVQVVMKWTGHSDYKSMKPYIDIADETKKSEMNKFNLL
uniref:site-specific integrase n=1 Tax=Wenyingzhuangia heitensis TaxID=1487859 RepID=UPI0014243A66|nr:site-specific integrase [Wenyingzhuangia heitensis]